MLTLAGCDGVVIESRISNSPTSPASPHPPDATSNEPVRYEGEHDFASLKLPPLPDLPSPVGPEVGVFQIGGSWVGELRLPSKCSFSEGDRDQNQPPLWRFAAASPKSDDAYWPSVVIDRSTLETTTVPIQGQIVFEDSKENRIEAPYVETGGRVEGMSLQGVAKISDDRRSLSLSGITYNGASSVSYGSSGSMTISGTIHCERSMPTTLPTRWSDMDW